MPEIKPFRALMYNTDKVGDLIKVLAPPYDVISPQEQDEYYSLSPYNIVHLDLGKTDPLDTDRNNQYTRARKFLTEWLKEKVFIEDRTPSIYIYEQEYENIKRAGFVALLRLEEPGHGVFPHEETYLQHRLDRLNILRYCRANFSPIFFLYSPSSRDINEVIRNTKRERTTASFKFQGVINRLWRVCDSSSIQVFIREMKNRQVFIADGHHRYEVSLKFSKEEKNAGYIMGMFVSMEEKGLRILPTHRLIKTDFRFDTPEFFTILERYFYVRKFSSLQDMFSHFHTRLLGFGMYFGKDTYYLLSVRNIKKIEHGFEANLPPCWRRLNMVILHHFFFHQILKVGEVPEKNIKYVTDELEAKKLVDLGVYNAAFFLNSIKPEVVRDIALSGERMPHKATYFYPKPLSGLLIYKF